VSTNPSAFAAGLPLSGGTLTGTLQSARINAVLGSIDVASAGFGLAVAEGANAKQGTAVLAGGTVTVANTNVLATSRIFVTLVTLGTVTVPSAYGVTSRVAGTSFTILASQATDTSTVAYEMLDVG
jgi:hypothetical protein